MVKVIQSRVGGEHDALVEVRQTEFDALHVVFVGVENKSAVGHKLVVVDIQVVEGSMELVVSRR